MRRTFATGLLTALVLCVASAVGAQVPVPRSDTTRRDTTRQTPAPRDTVRPKPRATVPPDTAAVAAPQPPARDTTPRPPRRRTAAASPLIRPPITPRRALIYSLLVPGLGQSRLDRAATGAFFVAIEAGALAMVGKSAFDLAQAKAFRGDSLVSTTFPVDTAGKPVTPTATGSRVPNTFSNTLVRARRLHLEDWLAVIAFNHLISGAEAFVSANLWDVPAEVSVHPGRRGTSVALTVAW
jgi:hypothetical protein